VIALHGCSADDRLWSTTTALIQFMWAEMCVETSKTYYAAPSKSLSLNRVLEGRDGLRVTLLGFLGTTTALEYFVTIKMACPCMDESNSCSSHQRHIPRWIATHAQFAQSRTVAWARGGDDASQSDRAVHSVLLSPYRGAVLHKGAPHLSVCGGIV
jgi:hypothetical protein